MALAWFGVELPNQCQYFQLPGRTHIKPLLPRQLKAAGLQNQLQTPLKSTANAFMPYKPEPAIPGQNPCLVQAWATGQRHDNASSTANIHFPIEENLINYQP